MADEHPPDDRSSSSSDESSIDAASEDDLDALLAEASALASEVSAELGESMDLDEATDHDEPPATTGGLPSACGDPTSLAEEDPSEEMDSNLAAIDALIDETQREVGTVEGEEAQATDVPEGTAAFVPDFMDEFTHPPEEVVAPQEPEEPEPTAHDPLPREAAPRANHAKAVATAPEAPAESKSSKAPVHPRDDTVSFESPSGESLDDESDGSDGDTAPEASKLDEELAGVVRQRRRRSWSLTELPMVCGLAGVRLLEVIDRPFARLGDPVRVAVGWLAVATFLTSLIVLLISFI